VIGFQFVADHSGAYPVKRLCQVIDIARSSYYAWVNAVPMRAARDAADVELVEKIRDIHTGTTPRQPRNTPAINHGRPVCQRVSQTDRKDHARKQHRGPVLRR